MGSADDRTAAEALQSKLTTAENEIRHLKAENLHLYGKVKEFTEFKEAYVDRVGQVSSERDTLRMKVEHLKAKLDFREGLPDSEGLAKAQGELAALRSTVNELAEKVTRAGCPWKQCGCGTTRISESEGVTGETKGLVTLYYVECTECCTEGLFKTDKLSAVIAWNER